MVTTDEFQDWLTKGLGRTVLYFQDHDAEVYREALLDACIHNLAYDSQCESGREEYLKDLVRSSNQDAFIREGLLRELSKNVIDADKIDFRQMVAVARLFAERGDVAIKQAIYQAASNVGFEQACDSYIELIAMDGLLALQFVSQQLPAKLDGFQIHLIDELLATLESRDGETEARQVILEASHDSPAMKIFADRIGQPESKPLSVDKTISLSYSSIRSMIQSDFKMHHLSRWGQAANPDDLRAAAEDLSTEVNQNRIFSYLSIFRNAKFPGSIDRLLELAESDATRLARACTGILSEISDPQIRGLVLKWMHSENRRGDAVELMTGNLADGDFARIELMLKNTYDIDSVHSIGMGLRKLVKAHRVPEAVGCLTFIYEHGPCSLCRGEIVELLIALNALPAWTRRECEHDADPDTRRMVRI